MANTLPAGVADGLLAAARAAFVDGMHVAAAIAAVVGIMLAIFAFFSLRERAGAVAVEPSTTEGQPVPILTPARVPKPARECF